MMHFLKVIIRLVSLPSVAHHRRCMKKVSKCGRIVVWRLRMFLIIANIVANLGTESTLSRRSFQAAIGYRMSDTTGTDIGFHGEIHFLWREVRIS